MTFNADIVALALAERDYFEKGVKKEYDDPQYKRIGAYWKKIGRNYDGRTKDEHGERIAWSAAFIGYLVRTAGGAALGFPPTESHAGYIRWAAQNRRDNVKTASFFAYAPNELAPVVGDIVCSNRGGGKVQLGSLPTYFPAHGALVVEVNPAQQYIVVVGGNESDSVGYSKLALDANHLLAAPAHDPLRYIALIRNTVDGAAKTSLPLAATAETAKKSAPPAPVSGSGVDTVVRLDAGRIACLAQQQQRFVLKYLYPGTANVDKNWTTAELALARDAGLLCGAIMQRRNNSVADFSRDAGVKQAGDAHARASELGQPGGSAIYFGVDFDASIKDFNAAVLPYFEGVLTAFEQLKSPYRVGAYGSALVLQELQKRKLIAYAWLPGSSGWGWGRYKAYLDSRQWDLHQRPDTQMCGFDVDLNECRDLFAAGLFRPA
ncbi:DUF2272 domain-containing protein [Hydrocarboniphaga sp.]|uniref:DUF2272 domain-containing protein n=1 Tax=Hydrocarboniphaga sp. TaxID=2033016 RepID=UPI003D12EBBF